MARKQSNINTLSRLLGKCLLPVYAVDHQRRIAYCNAACTDWLRLEPRKMMGRVCNYTSPPELSTEATQIHALCPPPEAFQGMPRTGDIAWPDPEGRDAMYPARFIPLGADGGEISGVLVIVGGDTSFNSAGDRGDEATALHAELREQLGRMGARYGLDQLIGQHPSITRAKELIRSSVGSDLRTLVIGPPGSGREHIARAMHYGGGHGETAPLAPLACNLLDAELLQETISSFVASCTELEVEQPAALLLLEVDQLPSDAQQVLASILRLGELEFRTVSTARQRLIDLAAQGEFRKDLAFALSTLEVSIPFLSQRRDDIPMLAQFFLEQQNAMAGKQLSGFAADAIELLQIYDWPGNVEQLAELVSEACQNALGPVIQVTDLPPTLDLAARAAARPTSDADDIQLDDFLAEIESELLQRAMRRAKGNKAEAARLLGISRTRLLRRLENFGLDTSDSDPPPPIEEGGC